MGSSSGPHGGSPTTVAAPTGPEQRSAPRARRPGRRRPAHRRVAPPGREASARQARYRPRAARRSGGVEPHGWSWSGFIGAPTAIGGSESWPPAPPLPTFPRDVARRPMAKGHASCRCQSPESSGAGTGARSRRRHRARLGLMCSLGAEVARLAADRDSLGNRREFRRRGALTPQGLGRRSRRGAVARATSRARPPSTARAWPRACKTEDRLLAPERGRGTSSTVRTALRPGGAAETGAGAVQRKASS